MSDTTSLSSNYSLTAEFAKEFNAGVLVLKRRYLTPDSVPTVAAGDEGKARKNLADHLCNVLSQLRSEVGATAPAERVPMDKATLLEPQPAEPPHGCRE